MSIALAQLILIISYIGPLWVIKGVQSSISASTYLDGPWKYLFYVWLAALGILNVAQGLGAWGFWAGSGLLFAGVTYNHKEELPGKVHYAGTVGAILFSCLGLGFMWGMWWPMIVGAIGSALLTQVNNSIWWIEILWFTLIMTAYMI